MLFVTPEDAALLDGVDLGEIAITSHAMVSTHAAPEDAFRLPDVAGAAAVFPPRRRRQVRPLLDDPAGSRAESRTIPISATAAPMRSALWSGAAA